MRIAYNCFVRFIDYTPVLSTAKSLFNLFKRCCFSSSNAHASKPLKTRNVTWFEKGSCSRDVAIFIPVLGNAIVAIRDWRTPSKKQEALTPPEANIPSALKEGETAERPAAPIAQTLEESQLQSQLETESDLVTNEDLSKRDASHHDSLTEGALHEVEEDSSVPPLRAGPQPQSQLETESDLETNEDSSKRDASHHDSLTEEALYEAEEDSSVSPSTAEPQLKSQPETESDLVTNEDPSKRDASHHDSLTERALDEAEEDSSVSPSRAEPQPKSQPETESDRVTNEGSSQKDDYSPLTRGDSHAAEEKTVKHPQPSSQSTPSKKQPRPRAMPWSQFVKSSSPNR